MLARCQTLSICYVSYSIFCLYLLKYEAFQPEATVHTTSVFTLLTGVFIFYNKE